MGLRRSSRIKQQQAEHKRLARSNTRKKKATNVKKDEKQQQQKTNQKEPRTTRSKRAKSPVAVVVVADKKTKEPKKQALPPQQPTTTTAAAQAATEAKKRVRKPRAKKRTAPAETVEKVSVIVAPKKKRTKPKAQKVNVITPLAQLKRERQESSSELLRRTKREDNQIQRDREYEQNVACRDRRSRLVLLATTRFLEINVVLKLKYQLETEKSNSASANVGNCDANNFDQVDAYEHEMGEQLVDMDKMPYFPIPCPERHIIPSFDLTKGVNNIIIHPDMDSNTISFPKKIWYVVNSPECKSIWWYSDGRSFIINKRWIKEKGELLDGRKYTTGISMNISDYSSLVRQLNLYGFRKVKRCLGSEMTEFQTHYMAAMAERHPYSEIVGKAALQDLDEFRHTFFTTNDISMSECRLGEDKVQFIKRQKPFKPTNNRKMPEKFDPKIRKSSAQRPSRHHAHTPSSHYSDESQSYFPAYGDARYSDDSDGELPVSAFAYNSAPFPGPWGGITPHHHGGHHHHHHQAPPFMSLPFDPQSAAEQLGHEFPFPLFKN